MRGLRDFVLYRQLPTYFTAAFALPLFADLEAFPHR